MSPQVRMRPGRTLTLLTGAAALVLTGVAIPSATADAAGDAWSADLSSINGDDVNVRYADGVLRLRTAEPGANSASGAEVSGQLITAPADLDRAASRVEADVDGSVPDGTRVTVDVRGFRGGVSWTEWVPAGSDLPAASKRVQVRITLTAPDGGLDPTGEDGLDPTGEDGLDPTGEDGLDPTGGLDPTAAGGLDPTVAGVRLTPVPAATASSPGEASAKAAALTYRVYATREGLVGGTTANGHVIVPRDHFVALPSRRGLSPKDTGTYSVRACSPATGRCEYAPVWDVGPWNTKDDYWNPSSTREMWKDLPQGTPEAQAAYTNGYNGGLDQFGRRVANPAGIDLADGTFWDGLGLTDNAWVDVTYLWTGTGPKGVVRTAGAPLTVRSSASTGARAVGLAANRANVIIECTVRGSTVTGTYGTSDLWNRIGPGHFVADAYTYTGSDDPVAPTC